MRLYVASKFENSGEVKKAIAALEKDGHIVTHDWTNEDATGKTGKELEDYLRFCADMDADGVVVGQGLLLLDHSPAPRGGYTELGIALCKKLLGLRMCIVVVGTKYDGPFPQNIFTLLVHRVDTLEEAREIFKEEERRFLPRAG